MLHIERKIAVVVAVILGAFAVLLTNVYFKKREAQFAVETKAVLVAAKEIPSGAVVDYEMLAFKSVPIKFIEPGALKAKELAVGKTALVAIMAGEQVLNTKLATPETGLTLASKTPPGKRAITIGFEATSAVGGMIRPGDHVDVLASFKKPPITLTLFQDILVLAVGTEMVPKQPKKEDAKVQRPSKETITLALSPQEIQIFNVADEHGKIQLTLRPRIEQGKALASVDLSNLPSVVDLNTLLQLYIKRPVVEEPQVEVIRGLKKEIIPIPKK